MRTEIVLLLATLICTSRPIPAPGTPRSRTLPPSS